MDAAVYEEQLKRAEEHYKILEEQLKQNYQKNISDSLTSVRREISHLKIVIINHKDGPKSMQNTRDW